MPLAFGLLVRPTIRDPLANDAVQRASGTTAIVDTVRDAVVIPKLELGKVAVQMLLAAMLINALHGALEDAEIALDGVAVDRAVIQIDILTGAADRDAVAGEMVRDRRVAIASSVMMVASRAMFAFART